MLPGCRLSVFVHPDKNPGDDARAAFEALNEAHRMLKDPGRLVGELLGSNQSTQDARGGWGDGRTQRSRDALHGVHA
jgi:DnaJ-class molecular chaperone